MLSISNKIHTLVAFGDVSAALATKRDDQIEDLDASETNAEQVSGASIINAWPKKYTGVGPTSDSTFWSVAQDAVNSGAGGAGAGGVS